MEKKKYISPQIEILDKYASNLCDETLETWSATKVNGGGTNTPEGKEMSFFEEESAAGSGYTLPSINYDVWAEDDEE